ncbi:hypothetical protein BD289DRAFT_272387 [Coniella lustricola]|uniref:Uncharacterized protein n=1 Tax=Coniella lustricola TaxID=2025994 RepID=A0A2T3AKJ6_9PEZI|nr:hypothetical protein BD289DRAFT_272387 [Coniella lustricola]
MSKFYQVLLSASLMKSGDRNLSATPMLSRRFDGTWQQELIEATTASAWSTKAVPLKPRKWSRAMRLMCTWVSNKRFVDRTILAEWSSDWNAVQSGLSRDTVLAICTGASTFSSLLGLSATHRSLFRFSRHQIEISVDHGLAPPVRASRQHILPRRDSNASAE